jgi:hypothetical protein
LEKIGKGLLEAQDARKLVQFDEVETVAGMETVVSNFRATRRKVTNLAGDLIKLASVVLSPKGVEDRREPPSSDLTSTDRHEE